MSLTHYRINKLKFHMLFTSKLKLCIFQFNVEKKMFLLQKMVGGGGLEEGQRPLPPFPSVFSPLLHTGAGADSGYVESVGLTNLLFA